TGRTATAVAGKAVPQAENSSAVRAVHNLAERVYRRTRDPAMPTAVISGIVRPVDAATLFGENPTAEAPTAGAKETPIANLGGADPVGAAASRRNGAPEPRGIAAHRGPMSRRYPTASPPMNSTRR